VVDVVSKAVSRLTNNGELNDAHPAWSPDGTRIAYMCEPTSASDPAGICLINPDGTNQHLITPTDDPGDYPAWSPDGTWLVYRSGSFGISVINADGSGRTKLRGCCTGDPAWSPDGTKIMYVDDDDTPGSLHTMNPDGTGDAKVVQFGDGNSPDRPSWGVDEPRSGTPPMSASTPTSTTTTTTNTPGSTTTSTPSVVASGASSSTTVPGATAGPSPTGLLPTDVRGATLARTGVPTTTLLRLSGLLMALGLVARWLGDRPSARRGEHRLGGHGSGASRG
jgi:dipeptidyl aminopeptidase/acylaminoacyl peptidase